MFEYTKKALQKLQFPGIRREKESLYNEFNKQYGFVFESNKTTGNYNKYRNAYRNTYVFRCIETEVNALRDCGFEIDTTDETTSNTQAKDYLTNLFNNPLGFNNDMTYNTLIGLIVRSLELVGDVFLEVHYDESFGTVNGFRYIQPQLLTYDNQREAYCFRNNPNLVYEKDELIHIYEPDPLDYRKQHFGVSKVDNISEQIQLILSILRFNRDVVDNDGLSPKSLISFDKDISDISFKNELDRLALLKKQKKRGSTLAVKGATLQTPNINNTGDWLELSIFCRDTILSNYGIPPIMLGIVETANLGTGTGESQREVFKTQLNGLARLIEDGFNKCLGRNGFREVLNILELDIEDKTRRIDIETKKLQNGIQTINEVRSGYGMEPVPWGDVPQQSYEAESDIIDGFTVKSLEPLKAEHMDIKKYKDYVYGNKLINYGLNRSKK